MNKDPNKTKFESRLDTIEFKSKSEPKFEFESKPLNEVWVKFIKCVLKIN